MHAVGDRINCCGALCMATARRFFRVVAFYVECRRYQTELFAIIPWLLQRTLETKHTRSHTKTVWLASVNWRRSWKKKSSLSHILFFFRLLFGIAETYSIINIRLPSIGIRMYVNDIQDMQKPVPVAWTQHACCFCFRLSFFHYSCCWWTHRAPVQWWLLIELPPPPHNLTNELARTLNESDQPIISKHSTYPCSQDALVPVCHEHSHTGGAQKWARKYREHGTRI